MNRQISADSKMADALLGQIMAAGNIYVPVDAPSEKEPAPFIVTPHGGKEFLTEGNLRPEEAVFALSSAAVPLNHSSLPDEKALDAYKASPEPAPQRPVGVRASSALALQN